MTDSKGKLLVIDDEEFVRDTIVGYLEDSGFEVIEADNGETGLDLFRQHLPDLILCDLRMPRMDGLVVLKNIMEESPKTPFIVVSGAGVMTDVVEALRLGASDYLVKPLADLAVLEHSVERNLERARLVKENEKYRGKLEKTNQSLTEALERLETDLQAGRQIQNRMLPPKELVTGDFSLQHEVIPSHFLSGDFVDYFDLDDQNTFFYIADVSGHGVSSAIITVLIKNHMTRLRDAWSEHQDDTLKDPAKVLTSLNRFLMETGLERHATVFLGCANQAEQHLVYCCAAHFPTPVVCKNTRDEDGELDCEALPTDGVPVGMFEDAEFVNREMDLSQVDGLFMCSDGLLEIMDNQTLVQKETRLLELIAQGNNTIAHLKQSLGLERSAILDNIPDDITLLTVNRSPVNRNEQ